MNLVAKFFKKFFSLMVILFISVGAGEAGIKGEGLATIFAGRDKSACKQAERNALRDAVEKGVGLILESKTQVKNFLVINDEIYSSAVGYVENYTKIKEEKRNKECYVEIDAEVSNEKIKDKLSALRILHKKMGNKRFVVLYNPKDPNALNENHIAVSDALAVIQTELLGMGFRVFNQRSLFNELDQTRPRGNGDGDVSEWFKVAQSNLVETIIEFELYATERSAISDPSFAMSAAWVTARIKAYDVASGQFMGMGNPRKSEQKQLTTAKVNSHAWESDQAKAATKAAKSAIQETINQIVTYYQSVGDIGNSVIITFKGFDLDAIDDMLDELQNMEGAQELKEIEVNDNFAKIEYFTLLTNNRLRRKLKNAAKKIGVKYDRKIKGGQWTLIKK